MRQTASRPGVVSVVTINYKGPEHTITCLRALAELDWPAERLEIICVDNDSRDGSVEQIRAACPDVTLIESPTNTGFTGGCALGVAHASGEYIAFLNNDARPDPNWLRAAVQVLEEDAGIGCVACKILSWDGQFIDFVDCGLTWNGQGFQVAFGQLDDGSRDDPRDMLFACGGAMVVRADLYRETGGFDDRFFMFFEDVDFGWRLNMLGHRVRYVPTSVVYHRHHGSIGKTATWYHRYLCERNALMSMYKNLSDQTLARSFAPAIGLCVQRSLWAGNDDTTLLDLRYDPPREGDTLTISKTGITGAFAVNWIFENFASLHESRVELQHRRVRPDSELIELFRRPVPYTHLEGAYQQSYEAVVAAFGLHDLYAKPAPPAPAGPDDLLDSYRAIAAERARRNAELSQEVREAKRATARAERALDRARAKIKRLEARAAGSNQPRDPVTRRAPSITRRVLRRVQRAAATKPRTGADR